MSAEGSETATTGGEEAKASLYVTLAYGVSLEKTPGGRSRSEKVGSAVIAARGFSAHVANETAKEGLPRLSESSERPARGC